MWTKDSVFCLLLSNGSRLPSATSVCGCRDSSFTYPFDLWPEWSHSSSWRRTTSEWMTEVEFTSTRWRGGCCCGEVQWWFWKRREWIYGGPGFLITTLGPDLILFRECFLPLLFSRAHMDSRPHMDTGASNVHYQQHGTALLCAPMM